MSPSLGAFLAGRGIWTKKEGIRWTFGEIKQVLLANLLAGQVAKNKVDPVEVRPDPSRPGAKNCRDALIPEGIISSTRAWNSCPQTLKSSGEIRHCCIMFLPGARREDRCPPSCSGIREYSGAKTWLAASSLLMRSDDSTRAWNSCPQTLKSSGEIRHCFMRSDHAESASARATCLVHSDI